MQERSIRVFYHVSMMNHYLDVVKEQMDLISTYIPNVSLEYVKGRSIDGITRRCLDNTKAKKILEWSPSVSIMEGIESILCDNYCKLSTI